MLTLVPATRSLFRGFPVALRLWSGSHPKIDIDFGGLDALHVLVEFRAAGPAGGGSDFGTVNKIFSLSSTKAA